MIRTVLTTFRDSKNLSLGSLDITTGSVQLDVINPMDIKALLKLQEELKEGYFYSDYRIAERGSALELQHSCGSVSPGSGLTRHIIIEEKPSFVGLLRKLIGFDGKFLSTVVKNGETVHEGVNISSLSITDNVGINLTHLIPAGDPDEEGNQAWRFTTDSILRTDFSDKYNSIKDIRLLCGFVDFGEYKEFLKAEGTVTITSDGGKSYEYNCYSVSTKLPLFSLRPTMVTSTYLVGILQYLAEAYKCARTTLTADLFNDKTIVSSDYSSGGSTVAGRYLKLQSNAKTNKKAVGEMSSYLMDSLSTGKNKQLISLERFTEIYPLYPLYKSIVTSEARNFIGASLPLEKKMAAYNRLRSTEALINLALLESKWQILFADNGSLFDLWLQTKSPSVNIPNYKISISGGGGTWRPNILF